MQRLLKTGPDRFIIQFQLISSKKINPARALMVPLPRHESKVLQPCSEFNGSDQVTRSPDFKDQQSKKRSQLYKIEQQYDDVWDSCIPYNHDHHYNKNLFTDEFKCLHPVIEESGNKQEVTLNGIINISCILTLGFCIQELSNFSL